MAKIDVTTEAHAAARAHCRKTDQRVSVWASQVLLDALTAYGSPAPVAAKTLARLDLCDDVGAKLGELSHRPPFWAGRHHD
jgi:hypothetical protein